VLEVGQTVTSVIDRDTKKLDTYQIQLNAGQTIRIMVKCNGCFAGLLSPDSGGRYQGGGRNLPVSTNSGILNATFTPAASGRYYFFLEAAGVGDKYLLSITPE